MTTEERARQIARDWSDLLGTPIGPDSDYRDAGGNSLSALRMVGKLRERFGAPVTIADLVAHVTPNEVAELIEKRCEG
jgi:acyl carrier protein